MSNILQIKELSKDSDHNSVLYNLNLNIEKNSINALIGFNGNGKEKLLYILAGKDTASSGSISFHDKPYKPGNTAAALKAGIMYISEKASLAPDLSIKDNILLGLTGKTSVTAVKNALNKTGLTNIPLNTAAGTLSAAQSRLLLLTKATLSTAEILLCNKLDLAFTREERNTYFSILRDLKSAGKTIIFIPGITDNMPFVDNFISIRDGSVSSIDKDFTGIKENLYSIDGNSIFPTADSSRNNNIIMESLGLKGTMLKDASVNIREKEICGLFGLIGSGISEILDILTGKTPSTGGVLSANHSNLQAKKISPNKRQKAGINIFNGKREAELDYDSRCCKLRSFQGNIIVLIDPVYGLNITDRKNFYLLINEIKMQSKAIILFTTSIDELKGISDTIAIVHNGELSAARSKNNWTDEEIYKYVTSGKLEAFSIL